MKANSSTYIILFVACIVLLIGLYVYHNRWLDSSYFSSNDHSAGHKALQELDDMINSNSYIPSVSDDELKRITDTGHIVLVKTPSIKEGLSFFHQENNRYWPYYYYSFPYNYKYGGAWPPGMYSRLYYWSPGFYNGSGWSYYMRPGMGYSPSGWPRNRWIRNTQNGKQSYYYVSNRDDYIHNAANYTDTDLRFHS